MVYFENAFRWSFFHHNLKMRGPSCKKTTNVRKSVNNRSAGGQAEGSYTLRSIPSYDGGGAVNTDI
jgi:hypothetical protein